MQEIWKDVPEYEGLYMVSNLGRIMSLHCTSKVAKENGVHDRRIMKNVMSSSGYYHVGLSKNGVKIMHSIHVLVARAFIPNPENKPSVNHIDGNRTNNAVSNLEWATYKENQQHAIRTGLRDLHKPHIMHKPYRARKKRSSDKTSYSYGSYGFLQYSPEGNFVKLWRTQVEAADAVGFSQADISKCVAGRRKMCAGFIWRKYNGGDIPLKIDPVGLVQVEKYSGHGIVVSGYVRTQPAKKCREE